MKTFVESFYEKTDNDTDRISKHDFLSDYESYYKLKNISWLGILNDMKRLGLNYHRQKRVNGVQGCITNLKIKENLGIDDDNTNNIEITITLIKI